MALNIFTRRNHNQKINFAQNCLIYVIISPQIAIIIPNITAGINRESMRS